MIVDNPNPNLTSIVVKLKLPTNSFELFAMDFDPLSLQVELALEYKHLYYKEFNYTVKHVPVGSSTIQALESQTTSSQFPYMRVEHSNYNDENWLSGHREIAKLLDQTSPVHSLYMSDQDNLHLELSILEDWINSAFMTPYTALMVLSDSNWSRVAKRLIKQDPNNNSSNEGKVEQLRKQKINELLRSIPSRDAAYEHAFMRLHEELIPLANDRLEFAYKNNHKFLVGDQPCMADLALYSFVKYMSFFDEISLFSKSSGIQRLINSIEQLPLNVAATQQNNLHGGSSAGRQKMLLLNSRRCADAEDYELSGTV